MCHSLPYSCDPDCTVSGGTICSGSSGWSEGRAVYMVRTYLDGRGIDTGDLMIKVIL
jgi:hypothetical protein